MNLTELKKQVAAAIENVIDHGQDPTDIQVSLQLEGQDPETNQHTETIWGHQDCELIWDNNGTASGCVIQATIQDREPKYDEAPPF